MVNIKETVMLQVLEPPILNTANADPIVPNTAPFIVTRDGQPIFVQIDYALYLTLQEAIEEWYADQRAIATYAAYLQDPSRGQDWDDFKAELISEGLLDG
jgi:hypothetical protein